MKRAVSISLGSPSRDKCVQVQLKDQLIQVERIGTGGDERRARQLFDELDGQVDALSVGGIDLYVRLDGRDCPIRAALGLVRDVRRTPLVDGRILKYVLERRVFDLAAPALGGKPHFRRPFMPSFVDRVGLVQAVSQVADEVLTNTTTPENIDLLRARGVRLVITSTPRYDGRSFGVNKMKLS